MSKVYINLHPQRTYAIAIVGDGYVDLKDFVQNVDWVQWESSRQMMISGGVGNEVGSHIKRVETFAQIIQNNEVEILVRDSRGDEWDAFVSKNFTNEEILNTLLEKDRENHNLVWAKQDLDKSREYLKACSDDQKYIFENAILHAEERIRKEEDRELERITNIQKYFDSVMASRQLEDYRSSRLKTGGKIIRMEKISSAREN